METKLRTLLIDAYRGVPSAFSEGNPTDVVVNRIKEANNGSTKIDYKALRDGKCPELFSVIEELIAQYEAVASKAILFIRNGNRILLKEDAEKKLPHIIVFFTNENLDYVLDILSSNDQYKEKIKEVKFIPAPKPQHPEISDDEIKDVIPEGSMVSHKKYGKGIVEAVASGRIKVLFDDSAEKIFAAQVCIDKQLLTVL